MSPSQFGVPLGIRHIFKILYNGLKKNVDASELHSLAKLGTVSAVWEVRVVV